MNHGRFGRTFLWDTDHQLQRLSSSVLSLYVCNNVGAQVTKIQAATREVFREGRIINFLWLNLHIVRRYKLYFKYPNAFRFRICSRVNLVFFFIVLIKSLSDNIADNRFCIISITTSLSSL